MEAKECRIGNWFLRLDNTEFQLSGLDISQIDSFPYYLRPIPIPLTEDWLMRFGFIRYNLKDVFYSKSYGTNGVAIVKFEPVYDRFCYQLGTGHNKVLDYVHQLMNLHYAITGSELTFKN